MIFRIESHQTNLITRENLEVSEWAEKLGEFISFTSYINGDDLINHFIFEFHLKAEQIENLKKYINNYNHISLRYYWTSQHFDAEPIGLSMKSKNVGRLIYWKEWDYIFHQIDDVFFLWVYWGGMTDMWFKIRLSKAQTEKYKSVGFPIIDYLVKDLRSRPSPEYEKAQKENRTLR